MRVMKLIILVKAGTLLSVNSELWKLSIIVGNILALLIRRSERTVSIV